MLSVYSFLSDFNPPGSSENCGRPSRVRGDEHQFTQPGAQVQYRVKVKFLSGSCILFFYLKIPGNLRMNQLYPPFPSMAKILDI